MDCFRKNLIQNLDPKRYRQQLHVGLDNFFYEGEATLAFTTQCFPHAGHPGPLCLVGINGARKDRFWTTFFPLK